MKPVDDLSRVVSPRLWTAVVRTDERASGCGLLILVRIPDKRIPERETIGGPVLAGDVAASALRGKYATRGLGRALEFEVVRYERCLRRKFHSADAAQRVGDLNVALISVSVAFVGIDGVRERCGSVRR